MGLLLADLGRGILAAYPGPLLPCCPFETPPRISYFTLVGGQNKCRPKQIIMGKMELWQDLGRRFGWVSRRRGGIAVISDS